GSLRSTVFKVPKLTRYRPCWSSNNSLRLFDDPKPDYKIARNWESEHTKKQVHLHNPTFVGQGIGTISGGTSGTINGLIVESSKREAPVPENQDYNKVPKRAKIEDWFRPCTPPHQIYSRNAYPHWVQECNNNESYVYDESSDLDNGKNHGEVNNEIDNIANEDIYLLSQETPQNMTEVYAIYFSLFLFDAPTNLLLDPDQCELSYRENFVNPTIVKVFDDIMFLIKVKTGEVENLSNKTQRNETRQYKQRVSIGCSQDGIYSINVNAVVLEVGFLEVIGNALYADIKKLNNDTEKVLKCMQISIHYQRQHYLSRGVTEQQVSFVESYGIVVY
ncbi:17129_t:CDS:2, partial [Acaulospora morrowiae]